MSEQNKTRNSNYDFLRVIASICVVVQHVSERVFCYNVEWWNGQNIGIRIFSIIVFVLGRLGVPLFLYLTGALVLRKDFTKTKDSIRDFQKRNLCNILICTEIWLMIYYLIYNIDKFSIMELFQILLFMKSTPATHLWYMPMIIGMYLMLPYVAVVINRLDFKDYRLPLMVVGIVIFVFTEINVILRILGTEYQLFSILDLSFTGTNYGFYIILGFILTKYYEKLKKDKTKIYLVAFVAFMTLIMLSYVSYSKNVPYNVWYNDVLLVFATIGLFMYAMEIKIGVIYSEIFSFIAKRSFGIYLAHIIVLHLMISIIGVKGGYVRFIVLNMLTYMLSLFLAAAMSCTCVSQWLILYKE